MLSTRPLEYTTRVCVIVPRDFVQFVCAAVHEYSTLEPHGLPLGATQMRTGLRSDSRPHHFAMRPQKCSEGGGGDDCSKGKRTAGWQLLSSVERPSGGVTTPARRP
jgi:hypothetical protein